MRIAVNPQVDAFRAEFCAWLASHPPPTITSDSSFTTFVQVGRSWQETLAAGGWIGMHWPTAYGGRGLSLVEEAVVQEELARAGAPQLLGLFGLTMVGPVLIKHGSEAQKSRFLPPILNAQEVWCQGFSEPQAGSDLAAVATMAVSVDAHDTAMENRGRGFVVTGRKIWTSFAQVANWCFVLCRTSRHEGRAHEGLTYLLIPMTSPGITVRPLKQITGDEEFNEVTFDDVFVPEDCVVGKVGDGWRIAIATLMYERVVLTFARHVQSERALREVLYHTRNTRSGGISVHDQATLLSTSYAVRALAYDHLKRYAQGGEPGPEGSLDKLFWSESFQNVATAALKALGREGLYAPRGKGIPDAASRYLYARGRTIAAGTSEIQRSIIAERILDLPRAGGSR